MEEPNEREVCGIFNAVALIHRRGLKSTDDIGMSVLAMCASFDLKTKWPMMFERVSKWLDEALANTFSRHKRSGMKLGTWIECNLALVHLFCDKGDVAAVLAAKESWSAVSGQVARLTASSLLGRTMLDQAQTQVSCADFSAEINAEVGAWRVGTITVESTNVYYTGHMGLAGLTRGV